MVKHLSEPPVEKAIYRIPKMPGSTIDTENHVLMRNGSHHLNHMYRRLAGWSKAATPRRLNAALEHHLIEVRDRGTHACMHVCMPTRGDSLAG